MAQPLYVNGAICTYATATGTIAPTTGLQLDGVAQSSALPQTVIATPSVSGLYLVTVYMRLTQPASGGASFGSTFGPMTVFFTCADCLLPISVIALLSIQDGTVQAGISNSDNSIGSSLIGSTVVNALAGQPISVSIGYASSAGGVTTCTASHASGAWDASCIELRSVGTIAPIGGNAVSQAGGAVTQTVTYSPTAGNAAVVFFNAGNTYTGLVVKDNLGHTLSAGPVIDNMAGFYQYPVPAGVTSYVATWVTARQSSLAVEEYSGVTSVNPSLAGNTASGTGTTATISVTNDEATDWTVCGFGSALTFTAVAGNQRQQTTTSNGRVTIVDTVPASSMAFSYHVKSVFLGGLPS